jgi:diacylglycerol kinase (ATP)
MRAAAILGLGCSGQNLKIFQEAAGSWSGKTIDWRIGMPDAADQVDVLLLFGGDGTVHRHLAALVQLGLPVLVVPAGSGNDFARALGLRRVSDSLGAWRRFRVGQANIRAVDLGVITPLGPGEGSPSDQGPRPAEVEVVTSFAQDRKPESGIRYFCCAAGVGLDGEIARRANHLPRWLRAHGGYALSLVPALFRLAPFCLKIHTPAGAMHAGQDPRQEQSWVPRSEASTVLAVFANTPSYGGGMRVAPRARMDDGQLDVCLVSDIDRFKLFCLFPTVYFGRHLSMPEVKYFQSERLRLETGHPLDVYADGEFVCRTPVEVGVQSGALNVLTL